MLICITTSKSLVTYGFNSGLSLFWRAICIRYVSDNVLLTTCIGNVNISTLIQYSNPCFTVPLLITFVLLCQLILLFRQILVDEDYAQRVFVLYDNTIIYLTECSKIIVAMTSAGIEIKSRLSGLNITIYS